MDIKTLLNNLHEEVSCSVCMTTFTDPKMLPCLHSFCLHCLKGIQRTSGRDDIIICPGCRRESRVPGGNLNNLPTNFRINSLLDVLAIKECNTTGVKCGNCDKKTSQSFYCFQCCAFWCEANCVSLHNGIKANKEHHVLALKDFQDEDFENVLKRPAFCQKEHHEKEELKFFCKICEVAICNACALTDHEGHAKMLLEKAANERKLQVKSMIESQKQKVQQKRNKITKLDQACIQIQEQAATVKRDAQKFAEKMIDVIEAKRLEIFNKADRQERELLERLVIQKSEIEHQVEITETAVERTETLLKRSTSAEIVLLDRLNTVFPEGVSNEREQVDCDLDMEFVLGQFVFVENETLMDKTSTEGIGSMKTLLSETRPQQSSAEGKGIREAFVGLEAQFVLTTRNAEGEQCYQERDHVTVEIRNQQGNDCATKVEDNKDGSYKVSYFAKEAGKCSVSVKVNEGQARGSPFSVKVKPRQYRLVLTFGQQGADAGMLTHPWGVAVNERNEIAVTDTGNHRCQVFSSDGSYLRSFGRKGDKQGEFNFPSGIAFDKNCNIIVVDSRNQRLQLFSELGDYPTLLGGKGNLNHQFLWPLGLSVDSDGNIIVADRNSKLIKIFSSSGQFLRKVGGEGYLISPWHCIKHDKYLIVSDTGEHCVKVFDWDGHFLYKFGKKGEGDGEFNAPRCLSVNKAGHLMVCDAHNCRVQVFELSERSGKFVTKFGKNGRGQGEFNKPVSTAVLSDGRIVVSDFDNCRIQIFQ